MIEFVILTLFADKNIIVQPILFIIQLIGLQTYLFQEQSDISFVTKNLNIHSSSILHKDKHEGLVFGKWFVGYLCTGDDEKQGQKLYIVMRKSKYKELQKKKMEKFKINSDNNEEKVSLVNTYDKFGSKWWPRYLKTEINYAYLDNRKKQKLIIDEIIDTYKKSANKAYVAFIHGKPGGGKSTIGYLIAREFESSYTDEWNPMDEGDNIINLISEVEPTFEKPLIVALDEVDKMIGKLDTLKPFKDCKRQIEGKADWDRFFDKVDKGRYPNIIFILTSNVDPNDDRIIDPALVREGRINKIFLLE